METVTHSYLCKLRIISKIPVNGRLDTTHNDLNIYYGGLLGWFFRKAYGDNKESATKYLIDLYREINSFSDQLMYNITTEQNEIRKRKKITMLVSLAEKIKESLTGIRNLIGTYKNYLKIVSLLECLEQDLIIPQYRNLINFIPITYHTEILKTAITYSHIHTSGIFGGRERSLSETDATSIDIGTPNSPNFPISQSIPTISTNPTNINNITTNEYAHNSQESSTFSIPTNSTDSCTPTMLPENVSNNSKSTPIDIPVKNKNKKNNINYNKSR